MSTENSNPSKKLLINAVKHLHQTADVGLIKTDLLEMYQSSLSLDEYNATANQRMGKFLSFQQLYNFLLKVEMYYDPEVKQTANLLES